MPDIRTKSTPRPERPGDSRGPIESGSQVQAARVLAGISQIRLAREAGINVITVRRMELARDGAIPCRRYSIDAVRRALEGAGVVFGEDGRPTRSDVIGARPLADTAVDLTTIRARFS